MTDPVVVRRSKIASYVGKGKRVGYLLFLVAMIAFFIGFGTEFSDGLAALIVFCLVAGSLILAPAIVFGYAVKAAAREDREQGRL